MLLDANALFLPVRVGFPLDAEIARHRPGGTVRVPASVIAELDGLVAGRTQNAVAARQLAARYPVVASTGCGDDAIVSVAVRRRATVVTADRALRLRLLAAGVPVLSPRDRHRLELHIPGRWAGAEGRRGRRIVKKRVRLDEGGSAR